VPAFTELLRANVAPVEAYATEYSPVKACVAESMLASRAFGESQRRGFESRPEHHSQSILGFYMHGCMFGRGVGEDHVFWSISKTCNERGGRAESAFQSTV